MSALEGYDIPLVNEIRKYPCIYNYNLPEYNRKDLMDEAWNQVCASLELPVPECKERWKNIRSSFVRSFRPSGGKMQRQRKPYYLANHLSWLTPFLKIKVDPESADFQPVQPQLKVDDVEYLQQYEVEDNIIEPSIKMETANSDVEETGEDPLNDSLDEIETPKPPKTIVNKGPRKRKEIIRRYLQNTDKRRTVFMPHANTVRRESNATKYFLLSLLPELESMNEEQMRQFKIKVMVLIDDLKNNFERVKNTSSLTENERLQKRLINMLMKNLDRD